MPGPAAGRPAMPGYGIPPADRGSGPLPWAEAGRLTDAGAIAAFVAGMNATYDAGLTAECQDPAVNGRFAVRPVRAFAISGSDLVGSPTRATFG